MNHIPLLLPTKSGGFGFGVALAATNPNDGIPPGPTGLAKITP